MRNPSLSEESRQAFELLVESGQYRFAWLVTADLIQEEVRDLFFQKRRSEGWLTEAEQASRRVEFRCCFTSTYLNRLELWSEMLQELGAAGVLEADDVESLRRLDELRGRVLRHELPEPCLLGKEQAESAWNLLESLVNLNTR
ncbi:MAG: hypothetical protein ACO4AU_12520 [bacterium]|jgi:hypothetical protein